MGLHPFPQPSKLLETSENGAGAKAVEIGLTAVVENRHEKPLSQSPTPSASGTTALLVEMLAGRSPFEVKIVDSTAGLGLTAV